MNNSLPGTAKSVSVAIINYNGRETLAPTIKSVLAQENVKVSEIILVDNHSPDGSADFAAAEFPAVTVVRLPENRGPNPARNEALRRSSGDYVLVMDNDIVLAPDYISKLADVFELDSSAGAVTGQIRLHHEPDTIQYNGTFIHFAGEVMLNRRESDKPLRVGCVSAGAVLLAKARALRVGGFDEDFFIGWEDGDFTFRLSLAGYPCYAVSKAVCFHIQRARNLKWVRYQTRNRWWFIGKNYDARTFFLALPAILLLQVCAGVFFLFKGRFPAFCGGTMDALASLPEIRRKRKAVQSIKTVGDARLLRGDYINLSGGLEKSAPGRLLTAAFSLLFRIYWRLIRAFLKN